MRALDRAANCTRAVIISTATSAAVCVSLLLGAAGAQAAAPIKKCPTARSLAAPAGTPLTADSANQIGTDLVCSYLHQVSSTKADSLLIRVAPLQGSESAAESLAEAYAVGLKASFKKLSGIGNGAWEYTQPNGKTSGNGIGNTTVAIVVGKREITLMSNLDANHVVAIAKKLG